MPYFIWPTDTRRKTSDFDRRRNHPVTGAVSYHSGVDIAQSGSHPIYAAASGVVVRSDALGTYGEVIMIEHKIKGVKYTTVYAHMRQGTRGYNKGDKVRQGAVIGYMGSTGRSTGQHLHFELHIGEWNSARSNAVDPLDYLFKGFWSEGDRGPDIEDLQTKFQSLGYYKGKIDGIFGSLTDAAVKSFQKAKKITVDGKVGPVTSKMLEDAYKPYPGHQFYYRKGNVMTGDDVKAIQSKVGTKVDGKFGPLTREAVITYQKANGLKVDGYVGPQTWKHMFN